MPRRSQECRWASEGRQAEIAQLVEHNLAKVGVAGPSPVFRSLIEQKRALGNGLNETNAQVAELVDAHVSGACAARRAGSSPVLGTLFYVGVRVSSSSRNYFFDKKCGNSSVGRAQPCQGWGRGSESRFPLFFITIIFFEILTILYEFLYSLL